MTRAMGVLGFSSTRWAEKTKGKNPKEELDKAYFNKMMQIQKRKDQLGKERENEVERRAMSANYGRVKTELAPDDENRELQEAYQFLLKKFELSNETQEKQSLISPFMQMTMDADEDWKLAKQRVAVEAFKGYNLRDTSEKPNEPAKEIDTKLLDEIRPKTAEPKGTAKKIDQETAYEINEAKKAEEAASKLATVTMNGLLAEPEPVKPQRQKSLKRKSMRRKSNASFKAARY